MGGLNTGVRIGSLDRRVILKCPQSVRTDSGHETNTFEHVQEVWAAKMEKDPSERVIMSRETMTQIYTWVIRYRSDVRAKWRLEYNCQDYDILGVTEIKRKGYLEIKTQLNE